MFKNFAEIVSRRWAEMQKHELFVTSADPEALWATYLSSFKPEDNPIFRERTEHDGSYDRSFIKRIGNVVAIADDGTVITLWDDFASVGSKYEASAANMYAEVKNASIVSLFRTKEPNAGHKPNVEIIDGKPHTWNHFYADMGKALDKNAAATVGAFVTNVGVMKRGLEEITPSAVDSVIDLIEADNLYRGDEQKNNLKTFQTAQRIYLKADDKARNILLWLNYKSYALMIRNTAIGTLLVDLSEGKELEAAVKSYEDKVSGTNYKRPKALVTPAMVTAAMNTITSLGLEDALSRRHATLADVSVNDVLWADNAAKSVMKSSLEDTLMKAAVSKKAPQKTATAVSVEEFLSEILPKASSVDIFLGNALKSNFVSITAPELDTDAKLFKRDNGFAWSYAGNIADSFMRKEVQARGGSVSGVFRFTHSWNHPGRRNGSLMDLHVFMPGSSKTFDGKSNDAYGSGRRIGWNMRSDDFTQGEQDVDFVNIAPVNYIPVENITFPTLSKMPDGVYECAIHNWSLRAPTEAGFMAEIEINGVVYEYDYPQKLGSKEWVHVASVTKRGDEFTIQHHIPCGSMPQNTWGLKTESFVRVQTVMLSPNHWGDQAVGNKHFFFLLEGAVNGEPCRGLYNEFLRSDLEQHRKVFELVGAKTQIEPVANANEQLSGVGFSSTVRKTATFRVDGRTYEVQF